MLSHPTILPPPNQLESTVLLDQAASLLLSTLGMCDLPAAQTLTDPSLAKRKRGRPLQLPWVQLWGSLLLCTLGGMRSFADFRRFIGTKSLPGFAPIWLSRNALVKRLLKAGLAPLARPVGGDQREAPPGCIHDKTASAGLLRARVFSAWMRTKLDRLARFLKPLRDLPNSTPALFAGKLLGLFDVRAQHWFRLEWREKVTENSLVDLLPFLEDLVKGTLLLFDLGYFSFFLFDTLTDRGNGRDLALPRKHLLSDRAYLLSAQRACWMRWSGWGVAALMLVTSYA